MIFLTRLMPVGVALLALGAMGCHLLPEGHLESIHQGVYAATEDFCVEDNSDDVNLLDAVDWIWEAQQGKVGVTGWESVPGITVVRRYECDDLGFFEREEITIVYEIVESGPSSYMLPPFDVASVHHNHENWDEVRIVLVDDDLMSRRNHIINHESGHAYGLDDPTSSKVASKAAETCIIAYDGNQDGDHEYVGPVPSIMHNGDSTYPGWCGPDVVGNADASFGNFPYASFYDLLVVELIAQEHPIAMDQYD